MQIVIGLILLVVLGLSAASQSPKQVEAELLSYAQSQVASVIRHPSIGRIGGGVACYEKYIPLITAATTNSKTETETCNNLASTRREDELNKVKDQRVELDNQVKTVQSTLTDCSQLDEALEFLRCLRDSSTLLQSTVEQVTKTSTSLADGLTGAYATIDNSENLCIQKVMNNVKTETDTLTTALQSCLMNGFDDPQPEPSSSTEGPSESSSSSSSPPEPSEEPQPETSPSEEVSSSSASPPEQESSSSSSSGEELSSSSSPSGEDSSAASSPSAELTPNYDLLPEEQLF